MKVAAAILIPLLFVAAARAENKVSVSLISSTAKVMPGTSFDVALHFKITPGWHTYWLNPGDAGAPPKVSWDLPEGITAGPLRYPIPRRISLPELMTAYGYENEFTLLTTITVAPNIDAERPIDLVANVKWVVCAESCILEKGTASTSVAFGAPQPQFEKEFTHWRAQQPQRMTPNQSADIDITVGKQAGRGTLSIPMPHDFETATEIQIFPPPLDYLTFDQPATSYAIVGGMMVLQPFKIQPGQHDDAKSFAMLVYLDGQKQWQSVEIPFNLEFPRP